MSSITAMMSKQDTATTRCTTLALLEHSLQLAKKRCLHDQYVTQDTYVMSFQMPPGWPWGGNQESVLVAHMHQ